MLNLLSLCLCLTLDSTMLFSLLLCFLSSCYARFPLLFHRICSALPALIASQTANTPVSISFLPALLFAYPHAYFISHLYLTFFALFLHPAFLFPFPFLVVVSFLVLESVQENQTKLYVYSCI
ncbi:hypothetical protein C8R42DRAFT_668177 [Lentinula raphanica]|nr:hypothetical protein C8R42DRAFT_668177 [Lentinula raphanica]